MERTREGVLGWVRAQGRRVSLSEMERTTGISKKKVQRLFPGGWGEVMRLTGWAGGTRRVDAREVVARLARLERKLGRKVTWNELATLGRKGNDSEKEAAEHGGEAKGEGAGVKGEGESGQRSGTPHAEARIGGTGDQYGRPLTASAVACAPINELGVVCLFGAMAAELGFFVLRVRAGFPDCEALRKADGDRPPMGTLAGGVWVQEREFCVARARCEWVRGDRVLGARLAGVPGGGSGVEVEGRERGVRWGAACAARSAGFGTVALDGQEH